MIDPTYYTLGKKSEELHGGGFKAAMMVRDLLSASQELVNMPTAMVKSEIDNIELVHARLSMIMQRVCNGRAADNAL